MADHDAKFGNRIRVQRDILNEGVDHMTRLQKTRNRLWNIIVFMVVLAILAIVFLPSANAADVTVKYTAPITCGDSVSPLTDCPTTGFEISEGPSATGQFTIRQTVGPTVTSIVIANVAAGTTRCYFAKTISNTLKSAESNRACVTVPFLPPKAPQGMTVTVVLSMTLAVEPVPP